jgi:hypothetical protein
MEREKSLLPATQPYVERELEIEKLSKLYYKKQTQLRQVLAESSQIKADIDRLQSKSIGMEKKQFVKKCPNGDCRGFLSTQWKCGLCEIYVCPDCHEIKGHNREAQHVCTQDNLETARLINKECKQCPKCACMIHKIDGCDLMWCTMCHTAFSWRSGRVENGHVHNPHYFEWLRQRGENDRNPLDVQCGREIDMTFVRGLRRKIVDTNVVIVGDLPDNVSVVGGSAVSERLVTFYLEKCRKVMHIHEVELPRLMVNNEIDNLDMRILFLRGKITEEEWKRVLQQREKKNERKRSLSDIFAMYVATMTDILYRFYDNGQWEQGVWEMGELKKYTYEQLRKTAALFNSQGIDKLVKLL